MLNKMSFPFESDNVFEQAEPLENYFLLPLCLHFKANRLLNKIICISSHSAILQNCHKGVYYQENDEVEYSWVSKSFANTKKLIKKMNSEKEIADVLSCPIKMIRPVKKILFDHVRPSAVWYILISEGCRQPFFKVLSVYDMFFGSWINPLNTSACFVENKQRIFSEEQFISQPALENKKIFISKSLRVLPSQEPPSFFQRLFF